MKRSIFKKLGLGALSFLLVQTSFAQSGENEHRHSALRIETGNIREDLSDALHTLTAKLKKIDFDKIGDVIDNAVNNIDINVDDIAVIVNDRQEPEHSDPRVELIGTAEKTRLISKTYTVGSNDKLSISNQYGKVSVHVWPKNEIRVNIEIRAFEATEGIAEDLLESVKITDLRQPDLISFKTTFGKPSISFWSRIRNGKEERRGVQVNYEIYMPAKNALDINNHYGSTVLPDFDGPVRINSAYGSFTSGKLDNPANDIKVSYGSAELQNYSNGNLTVAYGSLKLNQADKVNASIKYSKASISTLVNGGNFTLSYSGGFKIDDVNRSVKNLIINSSYSGVTLGIDDDADFNFDVTVSYAGFNYNGNKINLVSQLSGSARDKGWSPTKNYKGSMGKGSDSRIIIKSNYGGVKFL